MGTGARRKRRLSSLFSLFQWILPREMCGVYNWKAEPADSVVRNVELFAIQVDKKGAKIAGEISRRNNVAMDYVLKLQKAARECLILFL